MGLTLNDLKRTGKDLELSDAEWEIELQSRKAWIERTSSNDIWAKKIFKNVGILMTSHYGNRPFLKAAVETHKKLGYWIALAYDNYCDPLQATVDHNDFLPKKDILDQVDTLLIPHHQNWGGVLYPFFWLFKWGTLLLQDFEYIYCVNGDFVIEKPEGFEKLLKLLGDGDVISYWSDFPNVESTCFIARSNALLKIVKHYQDHFIPWENYEKYTQEYGNAEKRFARAIFELGLKHIKVPVNSYNEQMHLPGYGTWYELMGFRHIHGELNFAYRNKKIPPPLKYLDERYLGAHDLTHLRKWEETNDLAVLESWWAKE